MNKCTDTAVSVTYSTVQLPKIPVVFQRLLVHLLHLHPLPLPVLTLTYSWVSQGTTNNTLQFVGNCGGIFVFTFLWRLSSLHVPGQTDIQDNNIANSLAKTVWKFMHRTDINRMHSSHLMHDKGYTHWNIFLSLQANSATVPLSGHHYSYFLMFSIYTYILFSTQCTWYMCQVKQEHREMNLLTQWENEKI